MPISVPSVNILPVGTNTRIVVKKVEFAGKTHAERFYAWRRTYESVN